MASLAAILRKGTYIERPQARSGEELYWHALAGQYVALPAVGAHADELLRKHGWKPVMSEQAPSLQFDALTALRRLWPDLHKPHPDLIAHRLTPITCKELIALQPAADRGRMGRWLMARCKALGKHDLAGTVGEYIATADVRAGHPWATGRGQANQFLLGPGRDSAFILTGNEATGYTLNTFVIGDSAPRQRSGETIQDILTPNAEWSTADWDHYETLLTAKPASEAEFWDHPALIKFMGVRNSQVDAQEQPSWAERIRSEGAGALLGSHHAALQKRFLNAIPASWLDHMADDLGLQLNTQGAYRQLTDCWMALRTSDDDCATLILPAIRDANSQAFASYSDAQLLGLWRNSYQAITDHIRQTKAGQQAQLIRTTQTYSDLTPDAMREVLAAHYGAPAIDALVNAGKLHLLADHRGLPQDIRLRSSSNLSNIAGATTPDNQVYLIGNRITPQTLPGLFLHEVGEHAGLADMLGPDYGRISKHFQKLLREKDTYATWAAMRVPASTPAAHVPSEQLAYLVERVANDESARPGGEAGFALGQECLSNLRTWLFRTPLCRWLDDIGALDDFTLRPQDMASLAREAVDFFVEQTQPGTVTKNRNGWVDLLDPAKLDSLYRATPQDRIKALEQIGSDQAMGYLYALAMTKAPLIESAIEHFSATLAVLANGKDKPELQAVAGELLALQQNLDTQAQLKAQVDRAGFAMWIDGTSDPEQARLHFLTPSPKNPGMWQLNHYRKDIGAYDDDQYDSVEVALDQLQPASFMVSDAEAPTVLQQWAAIAGPDQQTRSQSFTRWFGASQAADPTGNALMLYHGTGQDIATFKGLTIWASTTPALANDYAEYRGTWEKGNANVMPVYMKAERPFDADKLETTVTLKSFFEGAAAQANAAGRTFDADQAVTLLNHIKGCSRREESGPYYRTHDIWSQASSMFGSDGAESVKALMNLLGFDSIKITEQDQLTFGVFEANQVKSAIGNRGTFSTSNNDIRYKGNNLPDTPAFKAWFGTSKIVNDSGSALMLYHGTDADFKDFKGDKIFFADCEYAARKYGKKLIPVYLNISNPKVVDYYGNGDNEIDADIEDAREEGHDGLIVRRAFDGRLVFDQYVAFEPSQVMPAMATEAEVRSRQAAFESNNPIAALKRWAGNTQVVGTNGLPKVVFTGTGADITRFDPAMIGTGADAQKTSTGAFWFSDAHQVSEMFAGLTDSPAIMPVFLRLENPLVVDSEEWARRFDTLDQGFKFGEGRVAYSIRWFKHEAIAQARAEGHDGVIFLKGYDGAPYEGAINYAVFEPNQIKSAIGNRGTFDQASDDIRLKLGSPTDTPAFKQWFANSKAVDESNNPLTLFHGTDENFTVFQPSDRGTFGPGIYFVANQDSAEQYGETIVKAHLSLQNPWLINVDYDSDAALAEDFDSPSVEAILTLPNGRELLVAAKNSDGMYDASLQKVLLQLGYDGVIATYGDGSKEYVAFNPEQVKSAIDNNGDFDPSNSDIRFKSSAPIEPPAVLYHGTAAEFSQFNTSPAPVNDDGYMGVGTYLTTDVNDAQQYALMAQDNTGGKARVIEVGLSASNPYRMQEGENGTYGMTREQAEAWTRNIAAQGYDAIVNAAGNEWVALDPAKIITLHSRPLTPVDTPEFKSWFRDSKVVDSDGLALRVYHGTRSRNAIDQFDLDRSGAQTDAGWMGKGFYFGDTRTANAYAGHYEFDPDHYPESGSVYPVYLSLQNPAILKDSERNDGPRTMVRELLDLPDEATSEEVRARLLAAGFDGVIYERFSPYGNGYKEYVAFNPEQIKSAIGNVGTFDPANPDIRFSVSTVEQARSYVPPHHMEAWIKSTGLPESVIQAYGKLGDDQRGEPEQAMVNAQDVMIGNPLSPVIEHVGDLTHRMSPKHNIAFAFEETRGKAENQLRTLRSKYGFARDVQESLERTANYRGIPLEELTSNVDAALERYAAAHERLEVHTEAQRLARDAAVALGRKDFEGAAQCLEELLEQIPTLDAFVAAQLPSAGSITSGAVKTNTPAFKNWFEGSKAVTNDGKPLVLYRGIVGEWDDQKAANLNMAWASESADDASDYVRGEAVAKVAPLFMSLKNPADLQGDERAIEIVRSLGLEPDDLYEITGSVEVKLTLEAAGYDSIKAYHHGAQQTHYAAFRSEQIKSAAGESVNFDNSNADIRFSFAGPSAQTANRDLLTQAQERVASGEDAEIVRRETGWFVGHDQAWRFELNDSKASLPDHWYQDGEANGEPVMRMDGFLGDHVVDLHPVAAAALGKASTKVTGILNHPELFAAYPQLSTINVILERSEGYPFAENGVFRRDTVNGQPYDSILVRYNPARGGNGLSALLHEAQHAIQKVEGFARGGSTSEFDAEQLMNQELTSITQRTNELLSQNPETATVYRAYVRLRIQANDAGWPEHMMANVAALEAELFELPGGEELFDLDTERFGIQFIDKIALPFEKYRQLAGEVEARNVQTRMGFDSQMRLNISPFETEDVAADQVDVRPNIASVLTQALQQTQDEIKAATEAGVLDMSREARLARAEALGFDTANKWYHGSNAAGFKVFDTDGKKNTAGTGAFFANYRPMAESYTKRNEDAQVFTGISLFNNPDQIDDLEIERFWVATNSRGRVEFEASKKDYDTAEQFIEGEGIELDEGDIVRAAYTIYHQGYEVIRHATEEEAIAELDALEVKEPGIYEVFVRYGDQLVIDWKSNNWDTGPAEPVWKICDEDDDVLEYCYSQEEADKALARHPGCSIVEDTDIPYINTNDAARQARDMGCDSVLIKNVYDNGPESNGDHEADVLVVFEPHNIRLTDAAFDPAKSASGNLLFSISEAPQSPAFDQWFNGSQACNEDGTPLVVYRGQHGPDSDAVFQSRLGSLSFGDYDTAYLYATTPNDLRDTPIAPRIVPAYLSIKRPLVVDHGDPFIDFSRLIDAIGYERSAQIATELSGYIENTNAWAEIGTDLSVTEYISQNPGHLASLYVELYPILDKPEYVEWLKSAGFDGAIYGGSGANSGTAEYRVFDPAQVASGAPIPVSPNAPANGTRMALNELPAGPTFTGSVVTGEQFKFEQPGAGEAAFGHGLYLDNAAAVSAHMNQQPGINLYAGEVITPAVIKKLRSAEATPIALRRFLADNAKALAEGQDAQALIQNHIQYLQLSLADIEMTLASMSRGQSDSSSRNADHYRTLEQQFKTELGTLINQMAKFEHTHRPAFSAEAANDFLAWDQPFNNQPAPVREALSLIGIDGYWEVHTEHGAVSFFNQVEAKAYLKRTKSEGGHAELVSDFPADHPAMPTGEALYRELSSLFGSPQEASARLKASGIQGIRYTTTPSPRGDARNGYVLFAEEGNTSDARTGFELPPIVLQIGVDAPSYPLPLNKLPAVALGGSIDSVSGQLQQARAVMALALEQKSEQLEDRHHWLSDLPNADAKLVQLNRDALFKAQRDLHAINRWKKPSETNTLPWDRAIGDQLCAKLMPLIRVTPQENITGEAIFHILAERMGSNKKAVDALLKVGFVGAHSQSGIALWDSASQTLAQHINTTEERERFHLVAHGSKHLIDRFSIDKIGTGEGGQAFGYGLYFADRKMVATHYQKMRIREGCWYENTFFDQPSEMIQSVMQRLTSSTVNEDLLNAARHCLSVVTWAPTRLDSVIEQYAKELHTPLKEIVNGYSKVSAEQLTRFYLLPKDGMRSLNEIMAHDDRDYSLGLSHLCSGLHFHFNEDMDEYQAAQVLAEHVRQQCDVAAAQRVRDDVYSQLQAEPNDSYLEFRLRDCDYYLSMAKCAKKTLDTFGPFSLGKPLGAGNLYLVDLANSTSEYFRYDLPLNNQSLLVQKAVKALTQDDRLSIEKRENLVVAIGGNAMGHDLLAAISGRKSYYDAGPVEDEKLTSSLLLEHGVQGIKYPDGLSRHNGGGSFNYVIFNDDRIQILGHTDKQIRSESDEIPIYEWVDTSDLVTGQRMAI